MNKFRQKVVNVFLHILQGGFALCRVAKKNESTQKGSLSHADSKSKNIGSSSSNGEFSTTGRLSNEPLAVSGDISSNTSYQWNESRYSSPTASLAEITPPVSDFEPSSSLAQTDQARFWVSPDLSLDSSKVINLLLVTAVTKIIGKIQS